MNGIDTLDVNRPDWQGEAACRSMDREVFFPQRGQTARPAKQICCVCPVQVECLAYALDTGQKHGVWGGLSERERRRLRRQRAQARAAA